MRPRSVSRLSYPEADEQRAWAWVGRAGLRPLSVGRRGILRCGASSSNTELCSCRGLAYLLLPFSIGLSACAPLPNHGLSGAPNSPIACSPAPPQRSLQGARPGPTCRLCPWPGGGGPQASRGPGGSRASFTVYPTSVLVWSLLNANLQLESSGELAAKDCT